MTAAQYPSLHDRVAFVSGGATGLGQEFVTQLAAQQARVAFVDIDEESGRRLVEDVAAAGHVRPLFLPCDVSDIPALQRAVAACHDELGPISVLVNNAANDRRQKVADVDVEAWDASFAVNLRHHFFATQAVAPQMRALGGGSVVNLGSISAHIDLVDLPSYIAAKAGVEGLTRTLARELGPDRIRVNCIIPGWVMTERQLRDWVTPEAEESIRRNQCLTEPVMPVDVARMLLWLAADDSRMCTAQTWVVDGGWM